MSFIKNPFSFNIDRDNKKFQIAEPEITPNISKDVSVSNKLSENVDKLHQLLHYPTSNDVQIREIVININDTKYNSILVSYDGLVDATYISDYILRQLLSAYQVDNKSVIKKNQNIDLKETIEKTILAECQLSDATTFTEVIDNLLHGDSALFVDSLSSAIICDTKKLPGRGVTKAENEMNLKGPSEAFVETFRTNTALIRKFVKDENLIFETIKVGEMSQTRCAIAYISTVTNDSLVAEVKRRINDINIDYLIDSGQLEQLIEDKTYLVEPVVLSTERPDKVASNLTEGRVAILVEGSNNVLIVPAVFVDFAKSSEESYVRFPYSNLLRLFRLPAIIFAIFLPGIYIAVCNFHQEMLPTDLLFAIAGTREKVPFTALIELLIMEIAFEIIREASIRTPAPVGPTLGIVGTLILGQAIVSANVVSPILVIIVALTGISAFAFANYALNYSFRILRFAYIFLGAICGFFRHSYRYIYTPLSTRINFIIWRTISYTVYTI